MTEARAVNDYDLARQGNGYINATSTRIRRFGAVDDGETSSMAVVVGVENARNQRLGA